MMKQMTRSGLCLVLLALSACMNQVSIENYKKIEPGMTRARVVELLGEPDTISSVGIGGLSGARAQWTDGEQVITIVFANKQVMLKRMGNAPPQQRQ